MSTPKLEESASCTMRLMHKSPSLFIGGDTTINWKYFIDSWSFYLEDISIAKFALQDKEMQMSDGNGRLHLVLKYVQ